jgi:anti-anti-sigma factor
VVGEVDLSNADRLEAAIDHAATEHPAVIVIDLSGVTFMDSTGLHALFKARKKADTITLRAPSREARRVIELSGLDSVARIE